MLNQRERTTVERRIKQLWKDVINDSDISSSNHFNQSNSSSIEFSSTTLSSLSSSSLNNTSTKKSTFSSFLNSVSINKDPVNSTSSNSNSIADELHVYKSLAMKEVQRIIDTESNPDASLFW